MASGHLVLIFMVVACIVLFGMYMFCYCYGGHGGRYFGSEENISKSVHYTKVPLPKRKCRCSNKFKGFCKDCEGPEFVDDGKEGQMMDFSKFGGDVGFDKNAPKVDPIRGFLGNGGPSGSNSGAGVVDHQGGGGESSGMGHYDSIGTV